ncbi:MAG: hypothetical protein AB4041_11460 [Microcystaceae cyanobacterium]
MTVAALTPTISSFCQVLDNHSHPIGITTKLSPHSLCLSLPKSFSSYSLFSIILKRVDVSPALTVKLVVSVSKSESRSDEYDDITVNIENPDAFQAFFTHCQEAKMDGLWNRSWSSELEPLSYTYNNNSVNQCTRFLSNLGVTVWQKLTALTKSEIFEF